MKNILSPCFLFIILFFSCSCNVNGKGQKSLEDSFAYYQPKDSVKMQSETVNTKNDHSAPCFTSAKLTALLAKIQRKGDEPSKLLSDADFATLDVMGLIVFAHAYPEQYVQSCSMYNMAQNVNSMIHSSLPRIGEGFHMSERQYKSMEKNRDSVIRIFNHCFENAVYIDDSYKGTILYLKAYEAIPVLKKMLNRQETKDSFILTVFMRLMKTDNYAPFLSSGIYKRLYDEKSPDYKYDMTIPVSKKTYDEILKLVSDYYASKTPAH